MKMNRYWLFQETEYEATGGLGDLTGTFESIENAKNYVENSQYGRRGDYSVIVDSKTWMGVWDVETSRRDRSDLNWTDISETDYSIGEPRFEQYKTPEELEAIEVRDREEFLSDVKGLPE